MRKAGILLPIFSLPSDYGIGDFGNGAYKFVDFLKKSKQKIWQILPLGTTSFGDSPYQSFSAFAGNPYFIDLNQLKDLGLLKKSELDKYKIKQEAKIDYEYIYNTRYDILFKAYERSNINKSKEFADYCKENNFWLDDFSLFMAVKKHFKNMSWQQWDDDIKLRTANAIAYYKKALEKQIEFHKFLQFIFNSQWQKLKQYANNANVEIMGDIPIYVALDSADVWSAPELYELDEELLPIAVAGCPPDYFSPTGQMWGNPLYNWKNHKQTGFVWWISRIKHMFSLYNILRIDHFLGFENYYSIPYGSYNAICGEWIQGPSLEIFTAIKNVLGDVNIIAEDLGVITDKVKLLLKNTGFCGMRVLEFGIFSQEDSYHLPHNYVKNSIAYTGTHDNETLKGAFNSQTSSVKKRAMDYLNIKDKNEFTSSCIKEIYKSISDTIIIPMADYLELDNNARINTPSVVINNWQWRVYKEDMSKKLVNRINHYCDIYFR